MTSYHVGSGKTPVDAIDGLLECLVFNDELAKERRKKGEYVVRNKLHLEHPHAILGMKKDLKKAKGHIIKNVDWRKWAIPVGK